MAVKGMFGKIADFIKKYRYAGIVLAVGIVLMLIPGATEELQEEQEPAAVEEPAASLEERLEEILEQIAGAGRVEVMLSVKAGAETVYQLNEDSTQSESTGSVQTKVVTVTDSDRNQMGLIKQIKPPVYLGAIIVCQGAENPEIRLAIVSAVSSITGLGSDKISVLKMK